MTLSTSRVVSSCSNSGLSAPGVPINASTAVPPLAALGTVAMGWQAPAAVAASRTATKTKPLREVLPDPDVGNRADKECRDDHPGGPVDLALEPPARAVAAAEAVAAAADGAPEAGRLRGLHQHAGHQQDGEHHLDDDESVLDPIHGWNLGILSGPFVQKARINLPRPVLFVQNGPICSAPPQP